MVVRYFLDDAHDDGCVQVFESKRMLPWPVSCAQIEFTPDGKYIVYRGGTSDIFVDYATLGQTLQKDQDDDCSKLLPSDVRTRLGEFLVL